MIYGANHVIRTADDEYPGFVADEWFFGTRTCCRGVEYRSKEKHEWLEYDGPPDSRDSRFIEKHSECECCCKYCQQANIPPSPWETLCAGSDRQAIARAIDGPDFKGVVFAAFCDVKPYQWLHWKSERNPEHKDGSDIDQKIRAGALRWLHGERPLRD